MKLIDRIFGRGKEEEAAEEAARPAIALAPLVDQLEALLEAIAGLPVDPDVVRARLADTFRDIGVDPVDPAEFDALAKDLDEGGWARLDLATRGAAQGVLGDALPALVAAVGARGAVEAAFTGFAKSSPLLTPELLRESSLRLEELSRRWIQSAGALVEGETPDASRAALERLDYGRLLAELERARMSAEERMAYLKKLQEEHDATRPRRGKW
jgi:hypothetical protein